ncbi:hypothetical protein GGX14DRAFT_402950 [Mycena pura]|uniref:Uncharacterized protein n=1 Tax=Mycena pura TaxID=153505 RepID=A0AAD6UXJ9_9AGAR|nr:hypothetical protein GGX14DRAFT_402950 [Mycena pura]
MLSYETLAPLLLLPKSCPQDIPSSYVPPHLLPRNEAQKKQKIPHPSHIALESLRSQIPNSELGVSSCSSCQHYLPPHVPPPATCLSLPSHLLPATHRLPPPPAALLFASPHRLPPAARPLPTCCQCLPAACPLPAAAAHPHIPPLTRSPAASDPPTRIGQEQVAGGGREGGDRWQVAGHAAATLQNPRSDHHGITSEIIANSELKIRNSTPE